MVYKKRYLYFMFFVPIQILYLAIPNVVSQFCDSQPELTHPIKHFMTGK